MYFDTVCYKYSDGGRINSWLCTSASLVVVRKNRFISAYFILATAWTQLWWVDKVNYNLWSAVPTGGSTPQGASWRRSLVVSHGAHEVRSSVEGRRLWCNIECDVVWWSTSVSRARAPRRAATFQDVRHLRPTDTRYTSSARGTWHSRTIACTVKNSLWIIQWENSWDMAKKNVIV